MTRIQDTSKLDVLSWNRPEVPRAQQQVYMSEDHTLKVIRNLYFIGINKYTCGVVDNAKELLIGDPSSLLQSASLYPFTRNYSWATYTFTYSPLGFG